MWKFLTQYYTSAVDHGGVTKSHFVLQKWIEPAGRALFKIKLLNIIFR